MKISEIEDVQAKTTLMKVRANMLLTKLLVLIVAAFAIWRIIVGNSPYAIFWIFASFAFFGFIWMQLFATRHLEKLEKISVSAVLGCYEYYYQKAKTSKRKNMLLLVKSKCNLLLGDYDRCLQTLEQVQKEQIALNYLGSYYMQLAIVKRLLGDDEGYQQNYLAYQNATNEKSPDVEKRMRLLGSENATDALQLITIRESFQKNRKILAWILSFAVFLFLAVLYSQGIHLLPSGYEYREWLDILGYYGVLCGSFFYATLIIVKLYMSVIRRTEQTTMRVVSGIVLIVCIILEVLMLLLFVFSELTAHKSESRQVDGTLYINQHVFLDSDVTYICEKEGLFFRKVLYYEQYGQNEPQMDSGEKPNQDTNQNKLEDNGSKEDIGSTETKNTIENQNDLENQNTTEKKQSLADLKMSREEERIANDYEAIYNYAYKATDSAPQYQYSAKGELYAVLGEYAYTGSSYAGTAVKAQKRLVFDRDSANEKYDLVVCYADYYDAAGNKLSDSAILEFYAVSKSSQNVIAADKHAWANPGSKEYKDATGE
jgi:hypothetical protein